MTLVWVTGNSGAGKSTVCEFLKRSGQAAALQQNDGQECAYRALGATIIDGSQPVADVAAVLAAGTALTA